MQKDVIRQSYIQTEGNHFVRNGEKIILRGWALGSWMNFEHFMMGLPGTHSMILEALNRFMGKKEPVSGWSRCWSTWFLRRTFGI